MMEVRLLQCMYAQILGTFYPFVVAFARVANTMLYPQTFHKRIYLRVEKVVFVQKVISKYSIAMESTIICKEDNHTQHC